MLLWDCKREALRGLGVNTGEGNTTRHGYDLWHANSCHNKELCQLYRGHFIVTMSWICCKEFMLAIPESYRTES